MGQQGVLVASHGGLVRLRAEASVVAAVADSLVATGGRLHDDSADTAVDGSVTIVLPTDVHGGEVVRDDEVVARPTHALEAVRLAISEVHLAIAAHARHHLFVHAGAVGWRGVGIVVPGRSMAGKSTLVAALVALGADYYSDEYAVLDDDGHLHPYPRPISLRAGGGRADTTGRVPVAQVARARIPIGIVAALGFDGGADDRVPVTLHGAAATLPLVENTVAARRVPARMLDVVARVASNASVVVGGRGDAEVSARRIVEWVGAAAP